MSARARGFTLIEMLAAVAVVAIALGAIIAGMARYTSNAAYLRDKTVALWVAHNRLSELALQRAWPDTGKSDGKAEMAGAEWKWEMEVQATTDPHLRRVDIRVMADKGKPGDIDQPAPLARLAAFIGDAGRK